MTTTTLKTDLMIINYSASKKSENNENKINAEIMAKTIFPMPDQNLILEFRGTRKGAAGPMDTVITIVLTRRK